MWESWDISRTFSLLVLVFAVEAFAFNVYPNLPRLPGDIHLDRVPLKITIPVLSPVIIASIILLLIQTLGRPM